MMTTSTPDIQSTVRRTLAAKPPVHCGASGTWYTAVASLSSGTGSLPTEFASARGDPSQGWILITREPILGEVMVPDNVAIVHPHLVQILNAAWVNDLGGRRLFAQITSCALAGAASLLPPDQVVAGWRPMISAVASALAYLHALGLAHGAVHLNNIFWQANTWQLGPSLCSQRITPADDLQALASLIGTDLRRIITDPSEKSLLTRLSALCLAQDVAAAHISVWAKGGIPAVLPPLQLQAPRIPLVERTQVGYRFSIPPGETMVFVTCVPHRAPRPGALVPVSDLELLGNLLDLSSEGDAVMPPVQQTVAVFCAEALDGIATLSEHVLIHPPRDWGDLCVLLQPEGVVLHWFWPTDVQCRKMR
ncbi:MAG: hypothetical protein WCI73_08630, partial [Phycisphaerae bacterium]